MKKKVILALCVGILIFASFGCTWFAPVSPHLIEDISNERAAFWTIVSIPIEWIINP